jgi:hypothetical protein
VCSAFALLLRIEQNAMVVLSFPHFGLTASCSMSYVLFLFHPLDIAYIFLSRPLHAGWLHIG